METSTPMRLLIFVPLVLGAGLTLHAQSVKTTGGNIVYQSKNGVERLVSTSGKDYDASLSPDGTRIVFAREVSSHRTSSGREAIIDESQIWMLDLSVANPAPRPVFARRIEVNGVHLAWFTSPRLS